MRLATRTSLLQLLYTYLPVFNMVFDSAPMGLKEWGMVLTSSLVIYVVVEIEKRITRNRLNL